MHSIETSGKTADLASLKAHRAFLDHTKCPPSILERMTCSPGSGPKGFFRLDGLRLYGRINGGSPSLGPGENLPSIDALISRGEASVALPFDPTEIIDNLRFERYVGSADAGVSYSADSKSISRRIYYALRPLFPVKVRRILQRAALQDWSKISFPTWPVDTTVDDFIDRLWILALEASGEEQIPFIWYWPQAFQSCAIMTHDVETGAGQEFCHTLLKLEQEYGIKSSFELVPEVRYELSQSVVNAIRQAGSEICVHGLNHDGRLFSSEALFRSRAEAINRYGRTWEAKGFRSPVMYRNLDWYDAFDFSYDMSVPNVAHVDPQRGGCCTIFPYFIGDIVELPLTTIQDYPLYNILRSDPMEMWAQQLELIVAKHGLASFIIHPDYTVERKRQDHYRELLKMLKKYGNEKNVWLALPGEVDTWWRERNSMTLTQERGSWSIRGKGSDRAALAYAKLENGKLTYVLPNGTTERVQTGRL
jgi:hypothetical protein